MHTRLSELEVQNVHVSLSLKWSGFLMDALQIGTPGQKNNVLREYLRKGEGHIITQYNPYI